MRILCPSCAATYEVPENRLVPGQTVRCARCDTSWVPFEVAPVTLDGADFPLQVPDETVAPAPVEMPVLETEAPPPLLEAPSQPPGGASDAPGGRWVLTLAWAASIALLLAVLAGAVAARESVMHAWPPSIRAFKALGLSGPAAAPHEAASEPP